MMKDRVLFVAVLDPFKSGGGSQATRAYLDATLSIFGKEKVDVVTNTGVTVPEEYAGVNFIFVPQRSKWVSYLLFFWGILGRFAVAVTNHLNRHSEEYEYCIFNGGIEAGWCFKHVKTNVKKVTIHHNQEVKYLMDTKNIITLKGHWPYTIRMVERSAYKYSHYNLFLTNQDMVEMRECYGTTSAQNRLIGTFDFKDAPIIRPEGVKKAYHLIASGTMQHFQTVHGIMDFYNRYYQITKKRIPNLKILLTGRNPSSEIRSLESLLPDVFTIISNPQDIMAQVQKGRIYLCPTDIGSGLKLRAMDGLKCGIPILVHEVSARGYDYFYDKAYYKVYSDESTFEKGLIDILNYLEEVPDSSQIISNDYYNYFGFENGVSRFIKAIDK